MNSKEHQTAAPLFDFHVEDIWPILLKQKNVVALFMVTVLLTTLIGGLLRTKEYRAVALIHLSPKAGQEVESSEVVDYNTRGFFEIQQFFRTQIQIIQSRNVREEVVKRYVAAGFSDLTPDNDGASALLGMMTVVPEEQSQLVEIAVQHTDPAAAAMLANLIAEAYSDRNLDTRRDASAAATEWIEGQLTEYDKRVAEANQKLHDFKSTSGMVDVEQAVTTLSARMSSLNVAFGDKSTELVLAQTVLGVHEGLLAKSAWNELRKALNSDLLEATARDYADAAAKDADLAARYGPKHPERAQSQARMASLEQTLHDEVRRVIQGEQARVQVLKDAVANLEAEITTVKAQMLEYQQKKTEFEQLKAEVVRGEGFQQKLSDRMEDVRLTSRTQLNNVDIVDRALAPTNAYKPNIPMSLVVAFIVGIVGGIGLALLREFLDDTISSQLDVAAYLKVPFLGLVPRLPEGVSGQEADLFTHFNPRSSIAEAVRGLRAMIEMNPNGPAPRRILVTSSVAREGKTSTTLRLGVSFAQMGKRVVLIDADLRRPRVHKVLGADNSIGLSSFLVDAANAEDIAIATPVPNLYAICAGPSSDQPAELLGSPKMHELLDQLEKRFDIILLDTPPSVALSDAVTLSRHVDGVLLVVKEQSVSRAVVKQTLDMMKAVDANILGVVLNNVDLQRGGSKYKYYYAYRDYYSNYDDQGPSGDSEKAAK